LYPRSEWIGQVAICNLYKNDVHKAFIYSAVISVIIVAINSVLRIVIVKLIEWVGEDTYSEQLSSITNVVFYAQFLNTGLLLPLISGNLTEHEPKLVTKYMNGKYYDYVPVWYDEVGRKIF